MKIKIRQASPTEDEVCKALSEYYGERHFYNKTSKQFGNRIGIITSLTNKNNLKTLVYLPPHLITMIGRFYENLEEE